MANTLAHLAVAHKILSLRPELVSFDDSYYLGSIAPDAIESKEGAVRDDKKLVHLRLDIKDMEWLSPDKMSIFDARLGAFIEKYIVHENDRQQRDFCIGYVVHLLTDKVNHSTVRLRILHALMPQGLHDGTWDSFRKVINEMEAMDKYLLDSRPEITELFYKLMSQPVTNSLPGLIEKEYLEKSQQWWHNNYIPQITGRLAQICDVHEVDDFIEIAAERIIHELDQKLNVEIANYPR